MHNGSASDNTILKMVNQRLARVSLGARSKVTATVHNGRLTLSGNLQYENQRRPALRAASGVAGVSGVLDQLKVQPHDPNRR